jgi:hypothetical protein
MLRKFVNSAHSLVITKRYLTCHSYADIPGLYYIPSFLNELEHDYALNTIYANPFVNVVSRRQQFYGRDALPMEQMRWIIDKLYDDKLYNIIPDGIFARDKSNEPTQLLATEYVRHQGIGYHIEDPNYFGDVIVTISLLRPIYLSMKREKDDVDDKKILLEPMSLLVMKDEARYSWWHGIMRKKEMTLPDGTIICRDDTYKRFSITVRRVLDVRFSASNKTARVT